MCVIEHDGCATADDIEDPHDRAHPADGPDRLLLLVDDDDDVRLLLGGFLRSVGYEAIEACDGADALAMLRSSTRRPVAIITDLAMPRLDGWAFIEAVRADRSLDAIPIIVVSSSACPPSGIRCLCKPLSPDQLLDALTGLGVPPPHGDRRAVQR